MSTGAVQDRQLISHVAVSPSAPLREWVPQTRVSSSAQTKEDGPGPGVFRTWAPSCS